MFAPEAEYERQGDVQDVVFPCGYTLAADGDTINLYYGAADPKGGAVESGVRFFASPTCHHVPEVYSAVGEREAATLLKDFFRERR